MRIGEFARRAGVRPSAIRFYERRGLFPSPPREANGYRSYSTDDLRIVRLIDQARSLGFSLADVQHFLQRTPQERRDKARLLPILDARLALLDRHIEDLGRQRAALIRFRRELGG